MKPRSKPPDHASKSYRIDQTAPRKDEFSRENVLAVSFSEHSNAYEALSRLKELDAKGEVGVRGAAVVVREEDGKIVTKEEIEDSTWEGTASGGLVGLLVGVIGGPLGVLIGGATGVLVGSLFDMDDDDATESALTDISKSVRVGSPGCWLTFSRRARP